jgi:predicted nucleic acid-binding protein
MILIDSNIPMYLVGRSESFKNRAQRVLEECIAAEERLVTDAEVLQEILHRYVAIQRLDAVQPAFDVLMGVVDEVFPILPDDVQRAKSIVLERNGAVSARDALHVAIMERYKIRRIFSFDVDFDRFSGIDRVGETA